MVVLTASAVALPAVLPPSPLSPSRALAASFPPCGPANDGQYWQDPDTDIEYQCVYNPATGVWEWVPKYMPGLAFPRAPEFEPIVHAETGGETAGSRPAKYTIKTPRLESGSTTLTVSWGDGTSTPYSIPRGDGSGRATYTLNVQHSFPVTGDQVSFNTVLRSFSWKLIEAVG